jgi:hypothetical protein
MVSRKNDFVRSMTGVGIAENVREQVHSIRFAVRCSTVLETPFVFDIVVRTAEGSFDGVGMPRNP